MSCSSPRSRGMTLILVAGVLAVLAALSTGFYTLMLMQTKSATRYSDNVRSEMMARAGIDAAIALLRQQAFEKTEDPTDPWFTVNYLDGAKKRISFADRSRNGYDDDHDGKIDNIEESNMAYSGVLGSSAGLDSDRYVLSVSDAASKINVNAGDNLAVILDNLCRVIGPPLVAADQDAIQPRRWSTEMNAGDAAFPFYATALNKDDTAANKDIYYWLYDSAGAKTTSPTGLPKVKADGTAVYGDGYAIAAYRSRHGRFMNVSDVKLAMTYVKRNTGNADQDRQLEELEREVKFAALKEFITVDSWVDTNTVCVGKFEWAYNDSSGSGIAIDRDKSWVSSVDDTGKPISDPLNTRGTLRGSYVSIVNGHGAGQLRRILENGTDWIQIDKGWASSPSGDICPGPISSYMIIAREDASADPYDPANGIAPADLDFKPNGKLDDNPDIDYSLHPLCIHRAPVNINTASDKVLTALFMGINVQHGHPVAIGTDSDVNKISPNPGDKPLMSALRTSAYTPGPPCVLNTAVSKDFWKVPDGVLQLENYILTPKGLKRVPASSGKITLDRPLPWLPADDAKFAYMTNYGTLKGSSNFIPGKDPVSGADVWDQMNEAHELAYRIIRARERKIDPATGKPLVGTDPDPITADAESGFAGYEKGPFKSWDDLFFRVIKPWDDIRSFSALPDPALPGRNTIPNSGNPGVTMGQGKASVARMIMAHFNSNTDILKFNPGIEWIDRWGRNFTEMEPVMVFNGSGPDWTAQQWAVSRPAGAAKGSYFVRSLRYKSDEMIDKTDLNRSTTEFMFDSGGVYEIHSVGQVMKRGEVLAEKRLEALVKVYDVWRESTQRQFVRGTISTAEGKTAPAKNSINGVSSSGYTNRGKIVRDNANTEEYLALDTLPEPLMPLKYRAKRYDGGALANQELVDNDPRDAWGTTKPYDVPDVVQNRVLPASYDGQIVLATNTSVFDPLDDADTFLASFNGDLDTGTCIGNGREQAKTPKNAKYRVVDTIGLLGILNDTEVDLDPDDYDVFVVALAANTAMSALKANDKDPVNGANTTAYWNNLSVRMGDMRAEGVFLGAMGTAAKDGTLKFPFDGVDAPYTGTPYKGPPSPPGKNYDPGNTAGCTVSVWIKSNWHAQDNREHEFFNGGSLGNTSDARYNALYKSGRFSFSKPSGVSGGDGSSGVWERNNCLWFGTEDGSKAGGSPNDDDLMNFLHGGTNQVTATYLPPTNGAAPKPLVLTPAYTVQPFRWANVGARWKYKKPMNGNFNVAPYTSTAQFGYWHGGGSADPFSVDLVANLGRPDISTQRHPEGQWKSDDYWVHTQQAFKDDLTGAYNGMLDGCDLRGQPAAYKTMGAKPVDHPNGKFVEGCFSINNVNESQSSWIYRSTPTDGTYAVIDELKISKKEWDSNRIAAEETLSRYYLPKDPSNRDTCPTFKSQTLLRSLRGIDDLKAGDPVVLARVAWTAFTPRFMHEYKQPDPARYTRTEIVGDTKSGVKTTIVPFKGPFDYAQYNFDIGYDAFNGWKHPNNNAYKRPLGVDRMPPLATEQPYSTQGIEIEVLDDDTPISGWEQSLAGGFKATTVFHNPDVQNSFADPTVAPAARKPIQVLSGRLRYRVRFRYPLNKDVDPKAISDGVALKDDYSRPTINPAQQYLLDTPVFDDISITYFSKPRILAYRDVFE